MRWLIKLLQPLRRWTWLDWLLTRLEAYTALLDQWGIRPSTRTVIETLGGLMLGTWAVLSETWLPVGIAIAIVVPAVLWSVRQRPASSQSATLDQSKSLLTASNHQVDRDLLVLLNYAVYQSTVVMLDNLLKSAPHEARYELPMLLNSDLATKYEASKDYIDLVRLKLDPGSWRRSGFENVMSHAALAAEHEVEQTPPDQRPSGTDHLALRRYAIAYMQCASAILFLKKEKSEAEEVLLRQRSDLLKQYTLRSPP